MSKEHLITIDPYNHDLRELVVRHVLSRLGEKGTSNSPKSVALYALDALAMMQPILSQELDWDDPFMRKVPSGTSP